VSNALPALVPRAARRQIWSVGGGKGGIGKSVLTAALGWQLARLGKRVVMVDADLGGANLHTCLGVPPPQRSLADFVMRRVERLEDVVVDTNFPRLRLISGAADLLTAANIKHQQKVRLLSRIRALDVDIVLIDVGAGTSFNILDFFLMADVSLMVVVPEPTSVENGYRFIKSALFRQLRTDCEDAPVRAIIDSAMDPANERGIRTPTALLQAVAAECPDSLAALQRTIAGFHPRFIVNQVRGPADVAVGQQLVTACARHLGIRAASAGHVYHDDAVWQAVRRRRLFAAEDPDGRAAQGVRTIARHMLTGEPMSFDFD
jgi:flagellar biosynthesis protein FlhG